MSEIRVYSSPACPHCHQLKLWLEANNIGFTDIDITKMPDARERILSLTGQLTIPVTTVDEEVVSGFDRIRLKELLAVEDDTAPTDLADEDEHVPVVVDADLRVAVAQAKELLARNRIDGRTRASGHLYPHQWNWDAGFISRGYLHYDPAMAYEDIRNLFAGQWSDGFLPHIIFNKYYLKHFPGPDYWKAEKSGRVPADIHTSGISQPPVHASMLRAAIDLDHDKDRAKSELSALYPKLDALHTYYLENRDPEGDSLVALLHPWESGLDNSPLWDEPLANVTESSVWAKEMQAEYDRLAEEGHRPKRGYIEKYSYLVESLWSRGFDWAAIMAEHPFRIQDVLFNSVLCRSERDLGDIADFVGADGDRHRARADKIAAAMNEKMWDDEEGMYCNRDLGTGRLTHRDTIFSYMPLYGGVCSEQRGRRVIDHLRSHCFCVADRDCVGIPTYDMCQADYDGDFYWRGPVWFNMCWYMIDGMRQYGETETALWLRDSMLQLVTNGGCYEYYEPETGEGLGADEFSWTAALFIDLAAEYGKGKE